MTHTDRAEPTNWIAIRDAADRADLVRLLSRTAAMDEAAPVRIAAGGGGVRLWARTPFGPYITRLFVGEASAADQVTLVHPLMQTARSVGTDGRIDLGYLMPSAWQGMLPPTGGFELREELRAQDLIDLSHRARTVAVTESGPAGIAPSLLEQPVITIDTPAEPLTIPMRMVFALTSAAFIPLRSGHTRPGEKTRLATRGPWLRLDARFGSVLWRPEQLPLSVSHS